MRIVDTYFGVCGHYTDWLALDGTTTFLVHVLVAEKNLITDLENVVDPKNWDDEIILQ